MPDQQLSLFSTSDQDREGRNKEEVSAQAVDAINAFDRWLDRQRPAFRTSSRKIYSWLWGKFIRSMQEMQVPFLQVEPHDIRVFLTELQVNRQQKERYHKIIARAFDEITELVPNLQHPVYQQIEDPFRRTWRNAPSNTPTQFLTPVDQLHLDKALISEATKLRHIVLQQEQLSYEAWRELRDIAIITILYSCGIKPAELSVLSVSCIQNEGSKYYLDTGEYQGITVAERGAGARDPHRDATHAWQQEGLGARRRVPIPGWAYRILSTWLKVRMADLSHHGQNSASEIRRLFPGTRKPSAARPNSMMNMATLARIVTKWGRKHAGLELTAQRLRNTYGAKLVELNKELPDIELLMGYAPGAASAFRLKASWLAFKTKSANLDADVVARMDREESEL